jgi:hypothetical protein
MVGVPRVQPLNDYRLVFMVQKGLTTYLIDNKVRHRMLPVGSRRLLVLLSL